MNFARAWLVIGSYNIHGGAGTDTQYDLERVAEVIRELGCDTVGLQEVDGRPGVESASMQLQHLASATGMTPIAACTPVKACIALDPPRAKASAASGSLAARAATGPAAAQPPQRDS
jgi:endonuclease/exonuclease/phosphatase family metal-dependent hydrolase